MRAMTEREMLERAKLAEHNGSRWTVLRVERALEPLNKVRLLAYGGPWGTVQRTEAIPGGKVLVTAHFKPADVVRFLRRRGFE